MSGLKNVGIVVQSQRCGGFFILPWLKYPDTILLFLCKLFEALYCYLTWYLQKKNFIKAKIQTTSIFLNRPKDQSHVRAAKGLILWVAVFKWSIFHIARLFHFFLAWICCNRQSRCINYDQKLICEIQLLFVLDVQSVEFFLMKKIYQCLWNIRQIILNFGGNYFPYGNFTCTGETKKSLRLWERVILIAKYTIKKGIRVFLALE